MLQGQIGIDSFGDPDEVTEKIIRHSDGHGLAVGALITICGSRLAVIITLPRSHQP
jgi:hypothetical protein